MSILANNSPFSNCTLAVTVDGNTTTIKQTSTLTFNTTAESIHVQISGLSEGYVVSYGGTTTLMGWDGDVELSGNDDAVYLCQFIVSPLEKTYELYSTNDANKILLGRVKLTYGKTTIMFEPEGSVGYVELAKNSVHFDMYTLKGLCVKMADNSIFEDEFGKTNFININGLNVALTDSSLVYDIETEGEEVDSLFCMWQMNVRVLLNESGTVYVGGVVEYGSDIMLLNGKVDSVLLRAFVAIKIGNDDALVFDIESNTINPEVVDSKYKYVLDDAWKFIVGTGYANDTYLVDTTTVKVTAVFDTAEFEASFLDTDGSVLAVGEIMYLSNFDFSALTPALDVYGYDFVGWIPREGTENYTIWSEGISDELLSEETQWLFESDIVFVAVEKVREYVVTFNPNGGSVVQDAVDVYYGQDFVHDDNWVPYRAGYTFMGYSDSAGGGTSVLAYDEGVLSVADNKWLFVDDTELFAQWELIIYNLDVYVNGTKISAYSKEGVSVEADDFTIDFSASKTTGLYTSEINYNGSTVAFANQCQLGVLEKADISSFVVKVADAVPASGDLILMHISLDKYVYFMSFDVGFFDATHNKIKPLSRGDKIYYLAEHGADISAWKVCDQDGTITGDTGWVNVMISYMARQWVFTSDYVAGLGLMVSIGGTTYTFKGWRDALNNPITLSTTALSNLNVYSYFDNNYDVNIEYYVKNSVGDYVLVQKTGTFVNPGDLTDEVELFNTYECFLMDGEIVYISGWKLIDGADETDCELKENIVLDARSDAYKFYAVYTQFVATFTTDNDASSCVVDIPNDYYGNSYSSADVIWDDTRSAFVIYAKDASGVVTEEVYCILEKV